MRARPSILAMDVETRWSRSADGIPLAYDVRGAGSPSLVFVHGWCGHRGLWDRQVELLRRRFRVLTLDLAGHGESGLGRGAYTMDAFGDDVARCVEAAGLGPAVLIGHSMAGEVTVEAALRLGPRVRGVIGVDTLWNVARDIGPELIEQTLGPFREDYPQALESYVRAMFLPGADPNLSRELVASMGALPKEVGLGALGEILHHRPTLRRSLRRLEVPVRLINSEDWRPTDPEVADAFGLAVRHLRGVGHFSMLEAPAEVTRAIEEELGQLG